MLQGEHSAILLTFIKLPYVIKIFVLFIFSGRLRQVLLYNTYHNLNGHLNGYNANVLSESASTTRIGAGKNGRHRMQYLPNCYALADLC